MRPAVLALLAILVVGGTVATLKPAAVVDVGTSGGSRAATSGSLRHGAPATPIGGAAPAAAKLDWHERSPATPVVSQAASLLSGLRSPAAFGSSPRVIGRTRPHGLSRHGSGDGRTASRLAAQNPNGSYSETVGGNANTWTNYTNAGGYQGPTIPAYQTVDIACKVQGFRVADGNTWWYLIASGPWNYGYYVSADAFYNNGATSGSLAGTPFVDPSVPDCGSGSGVPETAGGAANTWTNPANAGGTQGPTIGGGATVRISCKLQGFRVADGNTWWYRIAQTPWNDAFYVSADAFYNNGATSGSLHGTPFFDPAVPDCQQQPAPAGGRTETAGGDAHTWTNYLNAGGYQGPTIPGGASVTISCKLQGFQVADGNTWWYLIGSDPWSNTYFVSADAFYNNGATSGSLRGTPFVDSAVPDCIIGGERPSGQTTRAPISTWANYSHPGGQQGPSIDPGATIQIGCRVQGYASSDGNPWWYRIASAPWSSLYYVQASAFYNNGQTSGSPSGVAVDESVPVCHDDIEAPLYGTALASSNADPHSTSSVYGGQPVNVASGDFWQQFLDASVSGRGPGLALGRTYNSLDPKIAGPFGFGWSSSYDQHLQFNVDGSITVVFEDGSLATASSSGGELTLPRWADATLKRADDGTYVLTRHSTLVETFGSSSGNGRLLSVRDLNGNATTLGYDAAGHLQTITDSSGRALTLTTNADGRVASLTDPMGRKTTYEYDGAGNLSAVNAPLGRTWRFEYDADHRMTALTDPKGGTARLSYDSQGRVATQTDPMGLITRFAYDHDNFGSIGGTTTITDPHGVVRVDQYANGFLTKSTTALGTASEATTLYAYDPITHAMTSSTDAEGNVTHHTYDDAGRELSRTDPLGHTTSRAYNSLGLVTSETSPSGTSTSSTYDAAGNLLTTSDQLGKVTRYARSAAHPGDVASTTDPDGRVTRFTYDAAGNLASKSVTPSAGVTYTARFAYDANGEKTCEAPAKAVAAGVSCPAAGGTRPARTRAWTYDGAGRLVEATGANGQKTSYVLDADDDVVSVTDPDGNVTKTAFDANRRGVSSERASSASSTSVSRSAYDIAPGTDGCLSTAVYCTSATDPRGGTTVHAYDAQDREIRVDRPGGKFVTYTYGLDGERLTKTEPSGVVTAFSYAADGSLTKVDYSDSTPDVTFTYDPDGQRLTMTDGTGTSSYTYDARGARRTAKDGYGYLVRYTYNSVGDVTSMTYPNGKQVMRAYDGADRLASISDWNGNTTRFAYDPDGDLVSTTYPTGHVARETVDDEGAVTSSTLLTAESATVASLTYSRDRLGLVTAETDAGGLNASSANAYDGHGRLTSAAGSKFAYDEAGRLIGNDKLTQAFGSDDRLISALDTRATTSLTSGATSSYSYGPDGERTGVTYGWGNDQKLTYDAAHQLRSVTQSNAAPVVTGLSLSTGPVTGGVPVTIAGRGLSTATGVTFGGVPASALKVLSDGSLSVEAPPGNVGGAQVVVTTSFGASPTTSTSLFTYVAKAGIASLSPADGATAGGGTVTIKGDGFTGATQVLFGTVAAASFTVVDDATVRAVAPAGSGSVRVSVRTPAKGVTPPVSAANFTYADGIAVTGLSPATGPAAGGNRVSVQGTGFTGATDVLFGGIPAASFSVVSDTEISAEVPPGANSVAVSVKRGGAASTTLGSVSYLYAAVPTVTRMTRMSGSEAGGAMLTISGTGFSPYGTDVSFGGTVVRARFLSGILLVVPAPAGTGTVDVQVKTPGGTSAPVPASRFRYVAARTTYAYDGDGHRTATYGSTGTHFTWDGSQIIDDRTNAYIYGPGGVPVEHVDLVSGAPTYYFHDATGSTRLLLNGAGETAATFTYTPYGALRAVTGTTTTPILFAGGYSDANTGLMYLVNRYYDPGTGQFLTIDPAVDGTGSAYGYGGGDPVNNVDPLGLWHMPSFREVVGGAALVLGAGCVLSGGCAAAVAIAADVVGIGAAVSDAAIECAPPRGSECSRKVVGAVFAVATFGASRGFASLTSHAEPAMKPGMELAERYHDGHSLVVESIISYAPKQSSGVVAPSPTAVPAGVSRPAPTSSISIGRAAPGVVNPTTFNPQQTANYNLQGSNFNPQQNNGFRGTLNVVRATSFQLSVRAAHW